MKAKLVSQANTRPKSRLATTINILGTDAFSILLGVDEFIAYYSICSTWFFCWIVFGYVGFHKRQQIRGI